jgi:hypothetical protein
LKRTTNPKETNREVNLNLERHINMPLTVSLLSILVSNGKSYNCLRVRCK